MKTIWKYELSGLHSFTSINMPEGAEILDLQVQNGTPCLWAKVDPKRPVIQRTFHVYGTGHNMPEDPGIYIGTFQLFDGSLVLHVFETTDSGAR